ncbi:predicted protein [Sclerotinia sclerotiorum 1980 UF-70]|uniref:Uncharacterized protein n=1 Tax=Sclerotinia sclerotiorum (strain ATCC 18683 / 1980 / Ss-1) TaxID=665079 RepID=A7EQA0_SCLS1|nr:predicted protein [Sclerotinia sclerotiorum 1980 UF-70]EDO05016.1 predicted protein [Sclerotinia sclerotiorum 1980 UF-70]
MAMSLFGGYYGWKTRLIFKSQAFIWKYYGQARMEELTLQWLAHLLATTMTFWNRNQFLREIHDVLSMPAD